MLIIVLMLAGGSVAQEKHTYTPVQVEALYRWSKKGWTVRDTRLVANMHGFKPVEEFVFTKYGSDPAVRYKAKGYFYVKKIDDRWWMIDPEGYRHLNIGAVYIGTGRGETNRAAFADKFGTLDVWIEETAQLLFANGYSGGGAWSNDAVIEKYNEKSPRPLTRTPILKLMLGYARQKTGITGASTKTLYPNRCIFVFDPEFEAYCYDKAKALSGWKNDPSIVGYFSDNELPLGLHCLEGYLDMENAADPGRKAAEAWMARKKITRAQITDPIREEFAGVVIDRYYSIVAGAIRKYDPNHMFLGSRLCSKHKFMKPVIEAAGRYLDVVSINYYDGDWAPKENAMREWGEWAKKPFIISEFCARGLDSGLGNSSNTSLLVHTQRDRGYFYQNFTLALIESGNCVGWHWYRYLDNDPTSKGTDPSNVDGNCGIVNNSYEPYTDMLGLMRELNMNVYRIADYFDKQPSLK